MRHERDDAPGAPTRREERHLVDVLDQHIVRPVREQSAIRATGKRWPCEPRPDADDINPVERCASRATRPSAAEQRHFVTPSGESSENLVQMQLCPACLRILPILPIDEQNLHN